LYILLEGLMGWVPGVRVGAKPWISADESWVSIWDKRRVRKKSVFAAGDED